MDPKMILKAYDAHVALVEASDDGDPEGTFEALVSVFGNTDSYGDVIETGAFSKSLAEWAQRERPVPIVWSHQFHDVQSFLGRFTELTETDEGLRVKGQLDLDHPQAARVHKLMQRGDIAEFSFSGIVREAEPIDSEDEDDFWGFGALRIKDIDLWEAGPCFKGANPSTELLGIKSAPAAAGRMIAREGRVLAQKHVDTLRDVRDQLSDVITSVEKTTEETAPTPDAEKAAGQTSTEPPALDPREHALRVLNTIV